MPTYKETWSIAVITSCIVGTVAMGSNYLAYKKIQDDLPQAIEAVIAAKEDSLVAERKAQILSGWEKAQTLNKPGRHIYGTLDAEFTLVEFSDLECAFCKRFHDTPKQLVNQAGGKINWEWQHYPLPFHNPAAEKAAHAAECVAEDAGGQAFWAFTGEWFARSTMNGQGVDDIEQLAREVGAKPEAFRECMASGKYKQLIKEQMDRGTALGVTGTPATVVVDNTTGKQLLVKGAQQPQVILQTIGQLIEQRNQLNQEEVQ